MNIRPMTNRDLDFALNLTASEGWSSTRCDFEELLKFSPEESYIGEIDGSPVGMVTAVNYGEVGFIGNLIVLPMYRAQGFGKTLMKLTMKSLLDNGAKSIFLDGVPNAVSLYEQLGFKKIVRSLRLEGVISGRSEQYTRLMIEEDLREIASFDSQYFGSKRDGFLRMRLLAYPELARVIEKDDEIQGFIMGSLRESSVKIGPWVMRSLNRLAEHLLLEFTRTVEGSTVKIGVLENNVQAVKLLTKYGFKEKSHSWRMLYGKDTEATLSDHLYAICCPARG